ncbi:hypothetical protein GE061_004496 [Apolygus lucorum]|uniref:Peptidase S1 domain-containing protein n=1 Tax=Apolygus lucorum TaxID=248454 RepID=A0A8S9X158_APOLU|nr:hypothetical protein GE061_004496 [Apolygus lucorum]
MRREAQYWAKISLKIQVFAGIHHYLRAIVNGVPISIKDASWVLALMHEKTGALVCTAALIDTDWAITAANCVEKYGIHDVLFVLAGIDKLENKKDAQKAYVMYWHIHPCYVKQNSYDVALMKLSIKATAGNPIKIACDSWPITPKNNRSCESAGWGSNAVETTAANDRKDILLKATVSVAHGPNGCPCTLRQDQNKMVCTIKGGFGLCNKDFGGVLRRDNHILNFPS